MKDKKTTTNKELILDKVLEFSKDKGLFDCGIIVVGLSGGPDSVALLTILKELSNRNDINCDIKAFHCNHHLRPVVCDEEAEAVKALCANLGVEIKVLDFDCKGFSEMNHISEETAGRILRYEAFEQYAQVLETSTGKNVRIAIAHHKDDIAETMMMNLFRGAGLEGLVNPKSRTGRIIRPLLCLKKNELIAFLEESGIGYSTDLTNFEAIGTRNVWRNRMLPEIGEFYGEDPAVPLTRTYNLLSNDLDFVASKAVEAYKDNLEILSGKRFLKASGIDALHTALKSRAIRFLWQETFGELIDFEEQNLKDCLELLANEQQGEVLLDMPFGRKAYRHGDYFGFAASTEVEALAGAIASHMGFFVASDPVSVDITLGDTDIGTKTIKIPNSAYILKTRIIENRCDLEYNYSSWFCPIEALNEGKISFGNQGGITSPLRMKRAGAKGGKELKRLMTDLKIPESARNQILFAEMNGDILWLPGFGHGIGFTDAVSHDRYIAQRQSDAERFVIFAIERQ